MDYGCSPPPVGLFGSCTVTVGSGIALRGRAVDGQRNQAYLQVLGSYGIDSNRVPLKRWVALMEAFRSLAVGTQAMSVAAVQ